MLERTKANQGLAFLLRQILAYVETDQLEHWELDHEAVLIDGPPDGLVTTFRDSGTRTFSLRYRPKAGAKVTVER